MGYHHINFSRMMAPIDPAKPSILLYAPDREGEMKHDGPTLGHEPGMPIHYDLHVWLFKANPDGVFAPWNPRVTCS